MMMMMIRRSLVATVAALTLSLAVPAGARAFWGSIAIDSSARHIGRSHHQPSPRKAAEVAVKNCGTSQCEPVMLILDSYGVLVRKRNGAYATGIGLTKETAIRNARNEAHEKSARVVARVSAG